MVEVRVRVRVRVGESSTTLIFFATDVVCDMIALYSGQES